MQSVEQFEVIIAQAEAGDLSRPKVEEALSLARQHQDEAIEDDDRFGEWQHVIVQLEAILEELRAQQTCN